MTVTPYDYVMNWLRRPVTNEQGSRVGRLWCWLGWHHWVSWSHYQANDLSALSSISWACTRRGCRGEGGYDC